MEPETFARQFFDMWQDSFSNAMEDPAFNAKLLHLIEESNAFWYKDKKNNTEEAVKTNATPNKQPPRADDNRDVTIQKLAKRIEKCEQRIHVLEAIIRSGFGEVSNNRKSNPQGERNARIKVSKRA